MISFKAYSLLSEALASRADMLHRYGPHDPEDAEWFPVYKLKGPAPTLWTALAVVENILGKGKVTDDEDELEPGMFYVYQGNAAMFTEVDGAGAIQLPFSLSSTDARNVAIAAHESFHAYVLSKSKGGMAYTNEKIVNNLTERWLRKHLKGLSLHVALEGITTSRISYGKHHLSTSRRK